MKIAIIHGPNLNMLSKREPNFYGNLTLNEINELLTKKANSLKVSVEFFQSNAEGELVSKIQQLPHTTTKGIIINAAAYTHTSIAIRDALLAVNLPFIEVHLSNIYRRENFRQHSYLSDIAVGVIAGFGAKSYEIGLEAIVCYLKARGQA